VIIGGFGGSGSYGFWFYSNARFWALFYNRFFILFKRWVFGEGLSFSSILTISGSGGSSFYGVS
jgi:hypothetical protein